MGSDSSILFVNAADEMLKNLNLYVMEAANILFTAESGTEALELLDREDPMLVLAPLALGDMSGYEFCARVREVSPDAVLLLIGSDRGEAVYRQSMEAGASRYILLDDAHLVLAQVIIDCSKRNQARREQRALLKRFEQHSLALEDLPVPLVLLKPEGEVEFANKAFRHMADLQIELESTSLPILLGHLAPVAPASGWNDLLEAVDAGRNWSGELSCRRIRGDRIDLQVTLCLLPAVKEHTGSCRLLLMRNTGTEQAVQKRLNLQRQSAFDLLAAGNRHEDSLNGMLVALAQLASGGLTSRQDQHIQALTRQIHMLAAAEREHVYLSSRLTSSAPPRLKPFSLHAAITSLQASLFEQCKKHKKTMQFKVPEYVPDLYFGDDTVVMSLLASLLHNALFSGDAEDISITVDLKEKTARGVLLQFAVSFSFAGVAASSFTHMPDFINALQQGRETGDQSGLGLAVELSEMMGGKIWVRSDEGKGRSFCFTAYIAESDGALQPIVDPPSATVKQFKMNQPDVIAPPAALKPLKILLADDNDIDRLAILTLLESYGYLVTCVANGREAVDEFDCAPYDVVLMDILMPVMDGFEAARLIREKERLVGTHTPVYALTSYSLKAVQDKCIAVGMDGYLSKPVSSEELFNLFAGLTSSAAGDLHQEPAGQPAVLEIHDILRNLGGNLELYREIVRMFSEKAPPLHAELLEALYSGNAAHTEQLAHKLKGMSSNIGGARYAEVTRQIQDNVPNEIPGRSADWSALLESEFQELMKALPEIKWQELDTGSMMPL